MPQLMQSHHDCNAPLLPQCPVGHEHLDLVADRRLRPQQRVFAGLHFLRAKGKLRPGVCDGA